MCLSACLSIRWNAPSLKLLGSSFRLNLVFDSYLFSEPDFSSCQPDLIPTLREAHTELRQFFSEVTHLVKIVTRGYMYPTQNCTYCLKRFRRSEYLKNTTKYICSAV